MDDDKTLVKTLLLAENIIAKQSVKVKKWLLMVAQKYLPDGKKDFLRWMSINDKIFKSFIGYLDIGPNEEIIYKCYFTLTSENGLHTSTVLKTLEFPDRFNCRGVYLDHCPNIPYNIPRSKIYKTYLGFYEKSKEIRIGRTYSMMFADDIKLIKTQISPRFDEVKTSINEKFPYYYFDEGLYENIKSLYKGSKLSLLEFIIEYVRKEELEKTECLFIRAERNKVKITNNRKQLNFLWSLSLPWIVGSYKTEKEFIFRVEDYFERQKGTIIFSKLFNDPDDPDDPDE